MKHFESDEHDAETVQKESSCGSYICKICIPIHKRNFQNVYQAISFMSVSIYPLHSFYIKAE